MCSTSSARLYLFTANNLLFFFSLLVNLFRCQMKKFEKEETTVILSPFFFTKLTLLKTFHEITSKKINKIKPTTAHVINRHNSNKLRGLSEE